MEKQKVKKLYKSSTDKILSGVCAGIAEYAEIDPTLVRIGAVLITVLTGFFPGLVAYILMAIIMPSK